MGSSPTVGTMNKLCLSCGLPVKEKRFSFCSRKFCSDYCARRKLPLDLVLKNNSRGQIKKRLLQDGILENVCSECGLRDYWNDKPIVMHLDHINGVNNDNRITNLRMLCPNCHSQQETYAGRNARKKGNMV